MLRSSLHALRFGFCLGILVPLGCATTTRSEGSDNSWQAHAPVTVCKEPDKQIASVASAGPVLTLQQGHGGDFPLCQRG